MPHIDLGGITAGSLEVIIANNAADIEAAQKLRYAVFCEERGAKPTAEMALQKRDFDEFDDYCDHLLVVDHQPQGGYRVVGTYRMLRREGAEKLGRFYSESEFDISAIKRCEDPILEVGRSCVHADFRGRAAMQLLWRGIGAYMNKFNIALLFGCASFHGVDPQEHRAALSYLHHYHLAPPELRSVALPSRYVEMNLMPKEEIDVKRAFAGLPALIKGYLRLGGYIGQGAVIDAEYNTLDVGIIVKSNLVADKYAARYGADNGFEDL